VATGALLVFISLSMTRRTLQQFWAEFFIQPLTVPTQYIADASAALLDSFGILFGARRSTHATSTIRGIVMAIPVLLIFIALLSSADLVFGKYVHDLMLFHLNPDIVAHVTKVTLVCFVFLGVYSFSFKHRQVKEHHPSAVRHVGIIESSIVLAAVATLFLAFLIVQVTYLFGGEANITTQGFTYAEYARRGFFELLFVAVLTFFLVWGAEKHTSLQDRRHSILFKSLSSIVIAETLVIMISSFMRLSLYEEAYGFTTLRLYSHVFTVWLACILLLLLHKIYVVRNNQIFMTQVFISMIIFLVGMNVCNPDALIARKNIALAEHSVEMLDAYYLVDNLSDDAIPAIVHAYNAPHRVSNFVLDELLQQIKDKQLERPSPVRWQTFNLSRENAKKAIQSLPNF
jgi:hypothetical protein